MTELEKYIIEYFDVQEDDATKIATFFKTIQIQKGEFFQKKGKRSDKLAFIQKGVLREFLDMEDKEITKWISQQGYFIVDLGSFVNNQPSRWNIQALTDCELLVINKMDYENLGKVVPKWLVLEKLFIIKCFTILEDRILQHLSMTAEERYHQLFQFNKELFNIVPLQYLASMLGMAPETLSRLRKKKVTLNS